MAKYYSIASDGIVRGHSKAVTALRKIKRGGRLQVGGKPEWFTYAQYAPIQLQREREAREKREQFIARHIATHNDTNSWSYIPSCAVCVRNEAAWRDRHLTPTPEKP